jgi:hypothetical protein
MPTKHVAPITVRRRLSMVLVLCLAGFLELTTGCSYTEVQPINLRAISSLRTACSARRSDWLKDNVDLIEKRRAAGEMRDDEYETFMAIVRQAEGGDWSGASAACLAFQKAQRPTAEQIEAVRAFHAE